ncbi:MAG: type II secretion system F family protein [Actinomycetota bacterium]
MIALAATFVGLGIFIVAYGIFLRSKGRQNRLRELLEMELQEPTKSPEALSELMVRAGAYAERMIDKTASAGAIKSMLMQAGSQLKSGEFVTIVAFAAAIAGSVGWVLTSSALVGLLATLAAAPVGILWLKGRARKRLMQLESQLPAVLQLLAGSLDSGASLGLALELAADEGDPPLAVELSRVVAETRVGRPLLESLEAMAERIGSKDVAWTVEAIRIQHQTGGRLADTLRVLAEFMRARLEVRGEVRTLSAEARISAKVLTGMPIAIGLFLFFTRPGYLEPLLETGMGQVMLAMAAAGIVIGTLWMRKQVQVEV